ncbi:LysM peptidoglycan-binding domain-containing protein [uncultured Amnibacterium sp.]|uniref:LysM peptidoglycan-binding domain-containing protein n=1 Tax=uncultured Amnibacterium sp. TaxID=1631851 RepID=UPI0035CC11EA
MLTVQNDWIEYEAEPVQARRVAVRGGAACATRVPVGTQRVRTPAVPAPVARPRTAGASRLRLTRRGRIVLVVLPSLLLLSGVLLAAAPGVAEAAQPAVPAASPTTVATVVVRPGDSLWAIARRSAPHTDPRTTVAAIQRANHLSGSLVQAGDRLQVPAQG